MSINLILETSRPTLSLIINGMMMIGDDWTAIVRPPELGRASVAIICVNPIILNFLLEALNPFFHEEPAQGEARDVLKIGDNDEIAHVFKWMEAHQMESACTVSQLTNKGDPNDTITTGAIFFSGDERARKVIRFFYSQGIEIPLPENFKL